MKPRRSQNLIAAVLFCAGLSLPALAQEHPHRSSARSTRKPPSKVYPSKPPYSPYVGRNFPTRPFFGDTHLHTAMSFDAGMFGARLGPVEAYRFAKGEEVTSSSGQRVRLSRPLDFLVVADHSDFMGLAPDFLGGKPEVLADPTARRWFELIREGKAAQAFNELLPVYGAGKMPATMQYLPGSPGYRSAWQATIQAAEQANEPGRFTAFIGYEWTSNTGGNNLHRNVIFRDDGSKASQIEPYTTFPPLGSDDPRDLWKWMAAYEEKTGGRLLAICAQRQSLQRPDVPDHRAGLRWQARQGIRPDPHEVGAPLRGHPDQGRRRNASLPLAQRRVRGLQPLGQIQPRRLGSQEAGNAGVRIRALGLQERPQARGGAGRESLQVRPRRLDRLAHRHLGGRGGQFLRQDGHRRTGPGTVGTSVHQERDSRA